MIRSGSSLARILSAVGLALVVASAPGVEAQNPPRKVPGGPFVIPNTPLNAIEPGRDIQWTVQVTNLTPGPGVFSFVDAPQGNHLPPGPGGELECEPGGQGSASEQRAWQEFLFFPDADGDGQCEPGVAVLDAGGLPLTVGVDCDAATQILTITDINLASGASATIHFITRVSDAAIPASQVCNWGHLYSPEIGPPPNSRTDTFPYTGGFTAGCSCLTVAAPSGFDVSATKTATITAPGGRLIPGQPDSTVQYAITVTNTGGTDIVDGQLLDVVGGMTLEEGRGLEWVRIDDCPAPLRCELNPANTRLSATGINLASADPDESVTIVATARVTCDAATDTDNGRVCNQGQFSVTGQPGSFPTDDPDQPLLDDPTCVNVVWSNLTTSQKFVDGFDDANGNSQLDPGERVNFRIRARNAGTLMARGVIVTDDIDASGCLDPGTITALDGGVVTGSVITWDVGNLAPLGGSRDVRFSAALTVGTLCCNQASLQSLEREDCGQDPILTDDDSTSEDPAVSPPDPTCASPGPQPDLRIEKLPSLLIDVNGNGEYDTGDRVQWTITVENMGVGTATDVALNDLLPVCMRSFPGASNVVLTTTDGTDAGDASCSVAYSPPANPGRVCVSSLGGVNGIIPGERVTITFDAALAGGNISGCCNQATVTYAERSGESLSDDPSTPGLIDDRSCLVPPPCEPTGRLGKRVEMILDTDTDGRAEVGEGVQYELTFTNVGCGDLTNIRILDASQACLQLETATVVIEPPGAGTNDSAGGTVDVTFPGPLAPAESVTLRFTATSLAEGTCCNQATWTATELPTGGLSDDDVTDLTPERTTCSTWLAQDSGGGDPDLQVVKTITQSGCQDPGGIVNYQIVVSNAGFGTATTFTLSDVLPAGLTDVLPDAPLVYDAGTRTVSVTEGPLASRDSVTYKYQATLPCTGSGTITNDVEVAYTDSTGGVVRTAGVDVEYGLPILTTSIKTASPNPGADGVLGPGETVDYTITVTNSGTCDARGVVVTDVFEAIWDVPGATIGQGGVISPADTIRWDDTTTPALALIPGGGSVTLTVTMPVAAATTTETRDTNVADIVAAGHDLTTCGLPSPGHSPAAGEVCINCAVAGGQQDLLVEAAPGPREAVLATDQLATDVFENPTPNPNTCGQTRLNVAEDVVQTDVEAQLATGLPLTAAQMAGPLVFVEISNRCITAEGGSDPPIIVRKSGADFVVIELP